MTEGVSRYGIHVRLGQRQLDLIESWDRLRRKSMDDALDARCSNNEIRHGSASSQSKNNACSPYRAQALYLPGKPS